MLNKSDLVSISKVLDSKLKSTKEDITHIRKDQKTIIRFFDSEYLDLRKRIEKIEDVLKLSSN